MPFLTPFYPWLLVFLLCTNGIAAVMWVVNSHEATAYKERATACAAKHDAFVEQVKAAGRAAEDRARAIDHENQRIADETAKGWAAALDVVRRDANKRLRLAASRSAGAGSVSVAPISADRIDVGTKEHLPATERVIADCSEDTLKLVWLQHWITESLK